MKIEPFALERWLTRHELNVRYDIAESGILPLTVSDLLGFVPPGDRATALERLLSLPLGYNEAVGTHALRGDLAVLADKLAQEYSVMLPPRSALGYENYLRIGIGQRPEIFQAGLAAAGACFAALRT